MNERDRENLRLLAETIVKEEESCIIFVGAGLSRKLGYPDWKAMLLRLARETVDCHNMPPVTRTRIQGSIEAENKEELFKVSNAIFNNCEREFYESISSMFSPKEINYHQAHLTLIELLNDHLKGIITTNLDTCLESARDAKQKSGIVETVSIDDFNDQDKKSIFHIHGLRDDTSHWVICPFQYGDLYRGEFIQKLEGLMSQHTVLYLGTGLEDREIKNIRYSRACVSIPRNKAIYPAIKYHYAVVPNQEGYDSNEEYFDFLDNHKIKSIHYDVIDDGKVDEYGSVKNHEKLFDIIEKLHNECSKLTDKSSVNEPKKPFDGSK